MNKIDLKKIALNLISTFNIAGEESIELYKKGLKIKIKEDKSPVSNGDLRVNDLITNKIRKLTPNIPIISEETVNLYIDFVNNARNLMEQKNHDYGEAWRDMRVSSLTDLILMKILRVKQIENNSGKTLISEGIDANYYDMLNYAVFALIHLED